MSKGLKKLTDLFSSPYVVNTLIVVFILIAVWLVTAQYPFGSNTFIYRDLRDQYLGFYEHFNSVIRGQDSLMYSMNKGLGGSMVSLWAYYLMSPFNLIFVFLNGDKLILGVNILFYLKMLSLTLTATHYFKKKNVTTLLNLILTLSWVFSGYVLFYRVHLMWLDCLILLPLLTLALDRGLTASKWGRYTLLLTLTIYVNFYIGYMVCIYTVIYTLYQYLIKESQTKLNLWGYIRHSIYGGVMSLAILLPTAYDLLQGNGKDTNIRLFNYMTWDGVLSNFRFIDINELGGAPLLSMGSAALVLIIIVLVRVKPKYRKAYLTILAIYTISFVISPISLIWTLGRYETANLFRYSMTLVWFTLMFIANHSKHLTKQDLTKKERLIISIILLATSVPTLLSGQPLISFAGIIITVLSVLHVVNLYTKSTQQYNLLMLTMSEALIITLFASYFIIPQQADEYNQAINHFQEVYKDMDDIPVHHKQTYSIDKRLNIANHGYTYQTPLTSQASSNIDASTTQLYTGLGVGTVYSTIGMGMTDITQSLLGVDYVIKPEVIPAHMTYLSQSHYKKVNTNLYQNTITMPFAYTLDEPIPNYHSDDDFYYNTVTQSLFNNTYFTPHQLGYKDSHNLNIIGDSYSVKDLTDDAYLVYDTEGQDDVYIKTHLPYTTSYSEGEVDIFLSPHLQYIEDNGLDIRQYVYLGVELKTHVSKQGPLPIFYKFNRQAYFNDMQTYIDTHASLNISDDSTHTYLKGTLNKDTNLPYLQLSIPYIKGWRATINGKPANLVESSHRLAIELPEHTSTNDIIELRYITPYLIEGILLSLLGLTLCLGELIYKGRKIK